MAENFNPSWTTEIGAAAVASRKAGASSAPTQSWFKQENLNVWPKQVSGASGKERIVPTLTELTSRYGPEDGSMWAEFRDSLFDFGGQALQTLRESNELIAEGSAELQNSLSQGHTFGQFLSGEFYDLTKGLEQHGRNIRAAARGQSNQQAAQKKQKDEEARANARKQSKATQGGKEPTPSGKGRAGVLKKRNKRKLSGH